ncbi:MAG: 4-phosphoerythronate dehydrogenase [Bacteroidaceae bacterium]
MKVVIDDKIPYIDAAARLLFDRVAYLPGAAFGDSDELRDADALIVRTRTLCNRALLKDTAVRFIATATIGFDHIKADELALMGVGWTNCPGCNASSVGQYVRNSLLLVARSRGIDVSEFKVGIVGYGHVGRAVCEALREVGCEIMVNDPPLALTGCCDVNFSELAELAAECDVITFHTPLTTVGTFATRHLADKNFFAQLGRKPVIINAARGGVVDEEALLCAYESGVVSEMVIDTWENEPHVNSTLLDKAFIATPHIAGYSADGKSNATRMALRAVCKHFDIKIEDEKRFLAMTAPPALPAGCVETGDRDEDFLKLYNPFTDTAALRAEPSAFERLRGNYPLRRERFA